MKNWTWLSILLLAAMATACSDGDSDDKGSGGGTDAGATDKDGTQGKTDGEGSATDAGGGPVCMPSPYTPTAEDGFGKGCSAATDLAYVKALGDDKAKGDALRKQITECLLKDGCSGKGDAKTPEGVKKIQACTKQCILDKAEKGIGADCANCYAFNGTCGFAKCIGKCAVDPGSDGCKECMKCNCDPALVACMQLPTK